MTDAQTLDFLMKGAWFALEQAGRLVTDARLLFDAGSHSSAAGLALLSREELGKSRELFSLWIRAARETVTREDAVARIDDMGHVDKQRRGASTFTIPIDRQSLDVLLAGRAAAPEQYDEVVARQRRLTDRLIKRAPSDRTEQRERAFYVDASLPAGDWRRPVDMSRDEAKQIIDDARHDYWQQHRGTAMPASKSDLDRLQAALDAWNDKPELPPVEFRG